MKECKFNVAISHMMKLSNELGKKSMEECIEYVDALRILMRLLHPFAPITSTNIYSGISSGNTDDLGIWPSVDPEYLSRLDKTLSIYINGNHFKAMKFEERALGEMSNEELELMIRKDPFVQMKLQGAKYKAVFFPHRKGLNFMTS